MSSDPMPDLFHVALSVPHRSIPFAEQEHGLRAKLAHLAGTIPSLAPSVDEVLRLADDAEGSYKIDRLAEGYENLMEGREFADGRWSEPRMFTTRVAEEAKAVLERLAGEAHRGAATMTDLAAALNDWQHKVDDLGVQRPPNRHDRRRQAALARRSW